MFKIIIEGQEPIIVAGLDIKFDSDDVMVELIDDQDYMYGGSKDLINGIGEQLQAKICLKI